MNQKVDEISEKLLRTKYEQLGEREKKVAHHLAERTHIARNVAQDFSEQLTFGQRLADKVAAFGGSWTFISIFAVVLVVWVLLNSFVLITYRESFDPYPYILLNLFLSMLAAIQAPIILMSQNRQAYKDRLSAEHDYEVNQQALNSIPIPIPDDVTTQQGIVAEIEAEQALVTANRELIARFEKKIQATLARVWGEDNPAPVEA